MLEFKAFKKLIMSHGAVTHYTTSEGGQWIPHENPTSQYRPELNSMQAAHSLCFKDGIQWDEINGIRPKDCTWPPDAKIKDLRK